MTSPARGDVVVLDYPTLKVFRGRLRALMDLGDRAQRGTALNRQPRRSGGRGAGRESDRTRSGDVLQRDRRREST
jgi:hypothetical protein